jgi:hypothetical protein
MSKLSRALSGEWTDELLVAGPEGARYDWTADGAHVISLEDAAQGLVRVGWDGRSSEPFELRPQQSGHPLELSPDGLHVASSSCIDRSQPIVSDTSSMRPLYQSPPLPALAPIESWAVLSIRPMVVVDV